MANETVRSKIADKLADVIAPGANGDELADALRSGSKTIILTQAEYDALPVKDSNTVYVTITP